MISVLIFRVLKVARLLWRPFYRASRPGVRLFNQSRIRRTPIDILVAEQSANFAALNLDFRKAQKKVVDLLGEQVDLKSHQSQHYELVVAFSELFEPRRILEIGTADGSFAAFLSLVFPAAKIDTLDLPETDPRFFNAISLEVSTQSKEVLSNNFAESVFKRKQNLGSSSNIRFVANNSLLLSRFESSKYDLIWVDGDHTYPIVACDIANAVRLVADDGLILCDDVFLSRGQKGKWGAQETAQTLKCYESAGVLKNSFVLKSIRPEKNYSKLVKKHISVSKLLVTGQDILLFEN